MAMNDRRPEQSAGEARYASFKGKITMMEDIGGETAEDQGCTISVLIEGQGGQIIQFVVTPDTYFVNGVKIDIDSEVIVFYNESIPVMNIYPPRLEAVAVALEQPGQQVKLDIFNDILVSSDGTLQLTLEPDTEIISENGQNFRGKLTQRPLLAIYGATTRGIPAQTTPEKIVIMCRL